MKTLTFPGHKIWLILTIVLFCLSVKIPLQGACGKIVFSSSRSGNSAIWIMNEDGSGQTQLTFSADNETSPSFSPEGCRIAYVNQNAKELKIMNVDGTNQRVIYTTSAYQIAFTAWSPDGSKIAFREGPYNQYDIWVVNADGSNPVNLTNDGMHNGIPGWSPDGEWIVYTSRSDIYSSYSVEIWKMRSNGSDKTQLTFGGYCGHTCESDCPDWSPDGSKIVYCSGEYGNSVGNDMYPHDIWIMNPDGSNHERITTETTFERYPKWSPDNTRAAFIRDGDIYVKGILETRLTNTGDNGLGDWGVSCGGFIEVTSPNGGENWTLGDTQNITWEAANITGQLKITLWKDGVWLGRIAENLDPNDGSFTWLVGEHNKGTAEAGTGYTIKIKVQGAAISDISNNTFTLSAAGPS